MNYWAIPGTKKIISSEFFPHNSKHAVKKTISINPKYGGIWFGTEAINMIELTINDRIDFVIISDLLFIFKCGSSDGVKVMRGEPNNLRAQFRRLGNLISKALEETNTNKNKPINFTIKKTNSFFDGHRLFELKAHWSSRLHISNYNVRAIR